MHLNNHHENIERNIQLSEIKKFSSQITSLGSLKSEKRNTPLQDNPKHIELSSSKSSPNMVAVNILRRYNIKEKFIREIRNTRNREKLNSCLYGISKGNKKLLNELIEKKILEKKFVEKRKLEIIFIKQELINKGLLKEKDPSMKKVTSGKKKKKVKHEYIRIIYTPMGNKR
ncbi:MAG: hypothetical protein KIT66_07860 [Chitinophagaceae bacterium]|nr:hypothetical protein [Chitinophagaceae bacterium]MCZ2395389.1 hypothetical protein [Chitinophagales bacterium]